MRLLLTNMLGVQTLVYITMFCYKLDAIANVLEGYFGPSYFSSKLFELHSDNMHLELASLTYMHVCHSQANEVPIAMIV